MKLLVLYQTLTSRKTLRDLTVIYDFYFKILGHLLIFGKRSARVHPDFKFAIQIDHGKDWPIYITNYPKIGYVWGRMTPLIFIKDNIFERV